MLEGAFAHQLLMNFPPRFIPCWRAAALAGLVALLGQSALAQETSEFPGPEMTRYLYKLQQAAERDYEKGDYASAYGYYTKSLAWRGDKFAQYMIGYMHQHGQGVMQNPEVANAWFRLAAERKQPKLLAAYRDSSARLDAAGRERADAIYKALLEDIGDRKVIRRLIRRDMRSLRRATGTRVGQVDSLPLSIIQPDGRVESAHAFYAGIRGDIERRMKYLEGVVEYGELILVDDESDTEIAEPQR